MTDTENSMGYMDVLATKLRTDFEGEIPWFYLDSVGNVTVGVGCMIPTVEQAQALRMLDANGGLARPEEIEFDYARVKLMKPNCGPNFYRNSASLTLSEDQVMQLLYARLEEADASLEKVFLAIDEYPQAARLGLLDMIYNLGRTKMVSEYLKFSVAVMQRDWAKAALQCYRNGINQERNDWTKAQFYEAEVE